MHQGECCSFRTARIREMGQPAAARAHKLLVVCAVPDTSGVPPPGMLVDGIHMHQHNNHNTVHESRCALHSQPAYSNWCTHLLRPAATASGLLGESLTACTSATSTTGGYCHCCGRDTMHNMRWWACMGVLQPTELNCPPGLPQTTVLFSSMFSAAILPQPATHLPSPQEPNQAPQGPEVLLVPTAWPSPNRQVWVYLQVAGPEHIKSIHGRGGNEPRDLAVPVPLLDVCLPRVHKQQLCGEVLLEGGVVGGCQGGLLLGVPL